MLWETVCKFFFCYWWPKIYNFYFMGISIQHSVYNNEYFKGTSVISIISDITYISKINIHRYFWYQNSKIFLISQIFLISVIFPFSEVCTSYTCIYNWFSWFAWYFLQQGHGTYIVFKISEANNNFDTYNL